jgi:predicted alpha/beta-hydrolase family hydrolase
VADEATHGEIIAASIEVEGATVSALWQRPSDARAALVLAHGAGAGMRHGFMTALADALARRSIASLRFDFPYMERGSRRIDRPALLHATVRAAVARARDLAPGLPLLAGGKSMGGRMTSGAEASAALDGVRGLVFVGFPLHPAGAPATGRADHLAAVTRPMLFLQGTRDRLADLALLRTVLAPLGERARLHVVEGADHGFALPARLRRAGAEVHDELAREVQRFAIEVG